MAKALNVSLAVTADTSQAKAQLQQLQTTLQQLTANSANLKLGINLSEIQQASTAALQLAAHLKQATDVNTGTLNFTKFESQIRRSGQTIEGLGSQLLQLGPQGQQAFNQLAQAIAKSEIPMKRISNIFGQFGTVIANTVRWQMSSSLIHGIMGSIQGAYRYAQDLNESLNNIQIVTQMSDTQMSRFAESANKAAKALSTTTTSYTDAALIYYQQGIRDQNEINERTSATIKMANVTGQSAQQVSNQMTAIWNNFAKGGDNLEYYADVITALGAATASSSEEISKGLEKFAATADTVGLSYENATAALATITATTRQSADSVGTGLRTLFARLDSLKLGETLEDGVDLTKYTKALQSVGVQVLDANGNLKRMDDILDELGQKWSNISDTQKVALAQTVGGVRQYTTLMALMNNFDFYKENVDIAKSSEGTLQRQQEIYEKSWEASSKRVRASMETIFSTVISDQFFIGLNDGFAKFLEIINNVIKGLGGMRGLLLGLGGVLGQVFQPQITQGLYNFGIGLADLFTGGRTSENARFSAVSNLAAIMSGAKYNAQTGTVTGMGQMAYDSYSKLLNNQANFARNAALMSPLQQQYAQMVFDNQQAAIVRTQQAQQNAIQARQNAKNLQYDVFQQTRERTEEYIQEQINTPRIRNQMWQNAMSQARGEGLSGQALDQRAAALYTQSIQNPPIQYRNQLLTQRNQDINNVLKEYTDLDLKNKQAIRELQQLEQNPELLNKIASQNITGYTDKDLDFIKNLENASAVGMLKRLANGEDVGDLIAEASSMNSPAYANILAKMENFGINTSSKAFQDWRAGVSNASTAEMERLIAEFQQKMAEEQGEDVSGLSDKGKIIAGNITSVASGLMSAAAAGQSLKNVVNVFDQMNTGAISASEGIQQLASGLTQTAMQGMMAFNQLSSVVGGPLAAAIAGLMIALPYVVEALDSIYTSPEEQLENLHSATTFAEEQAQQALESYENLLNGYSGHSSMLEALQELTRGTLEYQQALMKANDAAYTLINGYNLGSEDWFIDSNGAVQIKPEAYERVQQEQYANMQQTRQQAKTASSIEKQYETTLNTDQFEKDYYAIVAAQGQVESLIDWWNQGKTILGRQAETPDYIENFAKKYGLTVDQLMSQYITEEGTVNRSAYQRDQMLRNGAATQHYQTLTESLLNGENRALTDAESLIASGLSTNEEFWNNVNEQALTVETAGETRGFWRRMFDATAAGQMNAIAGNLAATGNEAMASSLQTQADIIEGLPQSLQLTDDYLQHIDVEKMREIYALNGGSEERLKALEDSLQEGTKLTSADIGKELISQLGTNVIKTDVKKVLKDSKLEKQFNNFSKKTNFEIMELIATGLMSDNEGDRILAEEAGKRMTSINADYDMAIQTAFKDSAADQKKHKEAAEKITMENKEAVTNIQQAFTRAYGEAAGNWATSKVIADLESNVSSNLVKTFQSFQSSGSYLTDLENIKSGATSFGKYTEGEGLAFEAFEELRKSIGKKGLFEELYGAEDFKDTLKKLNKDFKETGEIGAQAILKAADSSESLSKFLETSGINAQGLSDVLTEMQLGNIDTDTLSSALLAAMSAAGSLNSQLAETYNYIDNFNQPRSREDITDFYSGLSKKAFASIKDGFWVDEPIISALTEMFGSDLAAEYRNKAAEYTQKELNPDEIEKRLNKDFEAEFTAMKSIEKRGNLSGLWEYVAKRNAGLQKGKGISYDKKTGDLSIDESQFSSFDELLAAVTENGTVSEDLGRSMINEYLGSNASLAEKFRESDALKGLSEFTKPLENGELINADNVRAYFDAYKDVFEGMSGKDIAEALGIEDTDFPKKIENAQQLITALAKAGKDGKSALVDLGEGFDFTTSSYDDLKKSFNENNAGDLNSFLKGEGFAGTRQWEHEGTGETLTTHFDDVADINKATEAFQKLGASQSDAYRYLDQMMSNGEISEFSADIKDAAGNMTHLSSESDAFKEYCQNNNLNETAESFAKYAQSVQDATDKQDVMNEQAEMLANGLAQAFQKMNENGEPLQINVELNGDAISGMSAAIESVISETRTIQIDANTSLAMETINGINGKSVTISVDAKKPAWLTALGFASGYNNAKGFAGGKHNNGQYQGMAELGELGPELWIHDGQPALAGIHGRTKVFVSQDDQIYTATQTKEILRDNPSLQDIPGFSTGYRDKTGKKNSGGSGDSKDDKGKDYKPERYHVISRQLTVLEKQYERLEKAKENAYGTNILDAIEDEIAAQDQVIAKQRELLQEVEKWKAEDLKKLKELGVKYTLDANGEIANWDALQKKYEEAAQTSDDENAKKIWEAIQQYEETIDKLRDETDKLQEEIYKQMQLRLEKITLQAELKIKFDDKQIELLNYSLEKLEDNIYAGAEALSIMSSQMAMVHDQIISSREAIEGIFAEMTDSTGKQIKITMDEFLAMSEIERDALGINSAFGEALEEQIDNLFDQIKALDEYKKNGVDRLSKAFDELTDNIDNAMDKFGYFSNMLSTLRDIIDLQNIKFPKALRDSVSQVQTALMNTSTNNIKAYQNYYRSLAQEADALRQHLSETTDTDLAKQYQEQLDELEDKMRDCMSNINDLWQTTLSQAKEDFEQQLDWLVEDYEEALSGIYGTLDMYGDAFERERNVRDRYVEDYEKYYQLSKLQRSINKDLDKAAQAGFKGNKQLRDLLQEIQNLQESGADVSAYELELLEKRYEYFKALADLEDARDAKHTVRLQRDRNGNWGYVYTANEDDLADAQQKVDDRLHELQEFIRGSQDDLEEQIKDLYSTYASQRVDMIKEGASAEALAEFDQYYMDQLAYLQGQWNESLSDAGNTVDTARDRYKQDNFEIIDLFGETATAQLNAADSTTELLDTITTAMGDAAGNMGQLVSDYSDIVERLNELIGGDAPFAENLNKFVTSINKASNDYLDITNNAVDEFKTTFDEIMKAAWAFEENFMKLYQPIIDANRKLVEDLQQALADLNRYKNNNNTNNKTSNNSTSPSSGSGSGGPGGGGKSSGGSGNSGSGGSGSGKGNGSGGMIAKVVANPEVVDSTVAPNWSHNGTHHWKVIRQQYNNGVVKMLQKNDGYGWGEHKFSWVFGTGKKMLKCSICGYVSQTITLKTTTTTTKSTNASIVNNAIKKGGSGGGKFNVVAKMDAGGYTGDWGSDEGRIAILHEKEQVFNKEDTARLLLASKILQTIDIQARYASGAFGNVSSPMVGSNAQVVQQNVQITASFPNAINHAEIEEAFNNLSNKAVQYANRKNK